VNITANASDDIAVIGTRFKVDGIDIGSEDQSAPYSAAWNTTQLSNGNHTLTATARDAAGNVTTSNPVTVSVSNSVAAPAASGSGPLAAYSFDAGSGTTVVDVSGNSNTLNLVNGAAWGGGKYGNAVSFDGSNDYGVAAAANPALNLTGRSFTLSAWVNPRSNSGWQAHRRQALHIQSRLAVLRLVDASRELDRTAERVPGLRSRAAPEQLVHSAEYLDACRGDVRRHRPAPLHQRCARSHDSGLVRGD
jgi:YD repeat-containing protein